MAQTRRRAFNANDELLRPGRVADEITNLRRLRPPHKPLVLTGVWCWPGSAQVAVGIVLIVGTTTAFDRGVCVLEFAGLRVCAFVDGFLGLDGVFFELEGDEGYRGRALLAVFVCDSGDFGLDEAFEV